MLAISFALDEFSIPLELNNLRFSGNYSDKFFAKTQRKVFLHILHGQRRCAFCNICGVCCNLATGKKFQPDTALYLICAIGVQKLRPSDYRYLSLLTKLLQGCIKKDKTGDTSVFKHFQHFFLGYPFAVRHSGNALILHSHFNSSIRLLNRMPLKIQKHGKNEPESHDND